MPFCLKKNKTTALNSRFKNKFIRAYRSRNKNNVIKLKKRKMDFKWPKGPSTLKGLVNVAC